jgi:hypothetical protein
MRAVVATLLVGVQLFSPTLAGSRQQAPHESKTPLSADEIAIYRAVLGLHVSAERKATNISRTTFPLDMASFSSDISDSHCLEGIELDNVVSLTQSFHHLRPDVLPSRNMRVVDPAKQAKIINRNDPSKTIRKTGKSGTAVDDAFATGMVSLSEIAFEKEHRYAFVSSEFRCGMLCGNGWAEVYEKLGEEWKFSRVCEAVMF